MKHLIIGDVHGKTASYQKIIEETYLPTIQIGDFGFKSQHNWHLNNVDNSSHKILFGNHDDYNFLGYPHSLGDYKQIGSAFFIRGAFSIDKHLRTEGIDWFPNEELSYWQMQMAIDEYEKNKPSIVISHDCPQSIRKSQFNILNKSITSNGLQIMLEAHRPDIWIFGHHHRSKNIVVGRTRFICLAELETVQIDI